MSDASHQQHVYHPDHLLEEHRTDRALAEGRHGTEPLRQGHCGDLGRHLGIEDPHRVEIEEVVEGRGGQTANESHYDERNYGSDAPSRSVL